MPTDAFFARGITEVGHVDDPSGAATDVPWGKTAEEGVDVQVNVTAVDLFSGQSTMEEDTGITRTSMSLLIRLVNAALQTIQRAYGMPDDAFTGDLEDATPTEEVLSFEEGDIGSEERQIYSLGVGPASTRRIEAPRSKVADLGPLVQAKTGWTMPQATWRILNPLAGGAALTITDGV